MPSAAAAVPVPLSTLSARDVRGRALMLLAAAALAVAAQLGAPAAPASATDGAIVLAVDRAELLGPDPMPRNVLEQAQTKLVLVVEVVEFLLIELLELVGTGAVEMAELMPLVEMQPQTQALVVGVLALLVLEATERLAS